MSVKSKLSFFEKGSSSLTPNSKRKRSIYEAQVEEKIGFFEGMNGEEAIDQGRRAARNNNKLVPTPVSPAPVILPPASPSPPEITQDASAPSLGDQSATAGDAMRLELQEKETKIHQLEEQVERLLQRDKRRKGKMADLRKEKHNLQSLINEAKEKERRDGSPMKKMKLAHEQEIKRLQHENSCMHDLFVTFEEEIRDKDEALRNYALKSERKKQKRQEKKRKTEEFLRVMKEESESIKGKVEEKQRQCDALNKEVKSLKEEIEVLEDNKKNLENRLGVQMACLKKELHRACKEIKLREQRERVLCDEIEQLKKQMEALREELKVRDDDQGQKEQRKVQLENEESGTQKRNCGNIACSEEPSVLEGKLVDKENDSCANVPDFNNVNTSHMRKPNTKIGQQATPAPMKKGRSQMNVRHLSLHSSFTSSSSPSRSNNNKMNSSVVGGGSQRSGSYISHRPEPKVQRPSAVFASKTPRFDSKCNISLAPNTQPPPTQSWLATHRLSSPSCCCWWGRQIIYQFRLVPLQGSSLLRESNQNVTILFFFFSNWRPIKKWHSKFDENKTKSDPNQIKVV